MALSCLWALGLGSTLQGDSVFGEQFPPITDVIQHFGLERMFTWMKMHGHKMPKPTVLSKRRQKKLHGPKPKVDTS